MADLAFVADLVVAFVLLDFGCGGRRCGWRWRRGLSDCAYGKRGGNANGDEKLVRSHDLGLLGGADHIQRPVSATRLRGGMDTSLDTG